MISSGHKNDSAGVGKGKKKKNQDSTEMLVPRVTGQAYYALRLGRAQESPGGHGLCGVFRQR